MTVKKNIVRIGKRIEKSLPISAWMISAEEAQAYSAIPYDAIKVNGHSLPCKNVVACKAKTANMGAVQSLDVPFQDEKNLRSNDALLRKASETKVRGVRANWKD